MTRTIQQSFQSELERPIGIWTDQYARNTNAIQVNSNNRHPNLATPNP